MNTEIVKRLNPSDLTKRHLFLLSRNECAFPGCCQKIVDEEWHYIGKICHIEAANIGGERFNPNQTNEQRRDFSNLVLMCGNHHDVTNDVRRYTVKVMKNIKANHESLSHANNNYNNQFMELFIDASLGNVVDIPNNYGKLDTSYCEQDFFDEAEKFILELASLPKSTRSFYAHALNNSYCDELTVSFDPREIKQRLNIDDQVLLTHCEILKRKELLSDLYNDEYPHKVRYYFCGKDYDDQQIFFLTLLRKYTSNIPFVLIDMIENLNFILLDI